MKFHVEKKIGIMFGDGFCTGYEYVYLMTFNLLSIYGMLTIGCYLQVITPFQIIFT